MTNYNSLLKKCEHNPKIPQTYFEWFINWLKMCEYLKIKQNIAKGDKECRQ